MPDPVPSPSCWDALLDAESGPAVDAESGPAVPFAADEAGPAVPFAADEADECMAIVPYDPGMRALAIAAIPSAVRLTVSAVARQLRSRTVESLGQIAESLAWGMGTLSTMRRPVKIDKDAGKVLELVKKSSSIMSLQALSEVNECPAQKVKACLLRYYACCFMMVRQQGFQMLTSLIQKVRSSGGRLIVFSEFTAYDETPLPLKTKMEESLGSRGELALQGDLVLRYKSMSPRKKCIWKFLTSSNSITTRNPFFIMFCTMGCLVDA